MTILRLIRDDRGATLAVTAVMIAGVLSMMALAIDLGMLRTARAEAQRAADSAALAGAQEFLHVSPASAAVGPAHDSAMSYATRNMIRKIQIDTSEVTIQVIPADQKVWVRIERSGIGLWFAHLIGIGSTTVNAAAAAAAMPAGAAQCVLPFAAPDMWYEAGQDTDGDRVMDPNEAWEYGNDPGEYYQQFNNNPTAIPPETGYGSAWRNGNGSGIVNDYGTPMVLKIQNPQQGVYPGWYFPFQIGSSQGANDYRNSISSCNAEPVYLNQPDTMEMGNMVGPTRQGVEDAIAQDRTAYWDPVAGVVSQYGLSSPRVRIVPLYDPSQILRFRGSKQIEFNNFGLIFLEGTQTINVGGSNEEWVSGRFLYYAPGLGGNPGGATGSLVRVLQLVE